MKMEILFGRFLFLKRTIGYVAFIRPYSDGGLVGIWHIDTFGLYIYPHPTLVFKLDSSGQFEWIKVDHNEFLQDYYQIIVAKNGDIIVAGADVNTSLNGHPDYGYPTVGYVRRLRPDGETRWERRIMDFTQGGTLHQFESGAELHNGDLVFAGWITDTLPDDPYIFNVWVVRLDSMGCLVPGCQETEQIATSTQETGNKPDNTKPFVAFPSPFSTQFAVGGILGRHIPSGQYRMSVFDANGRLMTQQEMNPLMLTDVHTAAWPAGWYVIRIDWNGRVFQEIKVVKS